MPPCSSPSSSAAMIFKLHGTSTTEKQRDQKLVMLLHNRQYVSDLFLLNEVTSALENFKVNEVEGHQPQGEAEHDPDEEEKQAREAGVEIPRPRPERNVVRCHH
ncbi:hypothetical protein ACFX15_037529 [Malus domestica]